MAMLRLAATLRPAYRSASPSTGGGLISADIVFATSRMLSYAHMGKHERSPASTPGEQIETETLDPRHFYAAYVFDRPNERDGDIETVLQQAQDLGYLVRYWWLSDAMELQGFPDRLIVCVHHPTASEDAGMDLYDALKEKGVNWDDLEAAAIDEYRYIGNPVFELGELRSPYGNWLFPDAVSKEKRQPHSTDALIVITQDDIRTELQERLGREPTDEELAVVLPWFQKALEQLGWAFYLDAALQMSVEARWTDLEKNASPGKD
ncbi:hypothetical protein ACFLZW_03330 [Chloroflexota bacterium]